MVKTKGFKSISIENNDNNVNVKTNSASVKLPSGDSAEDNKKDQTDNLIATAILGTISDVFYGKTLASNDAAQAATTLKSTIGSSFNSIDTIIDITTNINKNIEKIINNKETVVGSAKTNQSVDVTNNNTIIDDVRVIKNSAMIIADAIQLNRHNQDDSVLTYLDNINKQIT